MFYRFSVLFALTAACAAGATISNSVDCAMQRPGADTLTDSMLEHVAGDPTVGRFTGCFFFEPGADTVPAATVFSDAEGFVDRVSGGFSELRWFTNNVASSEEPGYLMSGSASTEMSAVWTTPGALRDGLLEISYSLLGDVGPTSSFSIGGFGCTDCSSAGFELIPFQLGTPFAVQASAFQSITSVTTTNGGFSTFGFVSFRATELNGTVVDFQETPEPGTLALTLLGVGALIGRRRFRREA